MDFSREPPLQRTKQNNNNKNKQTNKQKLRNMKVSVVPVYQSCDWLEGNIKKELRKADNSHRNITDNIGINRTKKLRKQKWEEKQLYGRFNRLTSEISHEKTSTLLRKWNLRRGTESLLIAEQNITIRTMSKQELIRQSKTADVNNVVTETKR